VRTDRKAESPKQSPSAVFLYAIFFFFSLTLSFTACAASPSGRQSRVMGDITIEADSIAHSGPNFVATGNITLAVDRGEPILSVGDPAGGTASL